MSESLEDFLGITKSKKFIEASNCALACPECNEIVSSGKLDQEDMIIYYSCTNGHNARVKI